LEESSRTARMLEEDSQAEIAEVVINRAVTRKSTCKRCQERFRLFEAARKFVSRRFPNAELRTGEDPGAPLIGIDKLRAFGEHLYRTAGGGRLENRTAAGRRGVGAGRMAISEQHHATLKLQSVRPKKAGDVTLQPTDWPDANTQLTLTLGKGGVGKTT